MTYRKNQKRSCHSFKVLEDLNEWKETENKLQQESQHIWEHLENLKARMDLWIVLEQGRLLEGWHGPIGLHFHKRKNSTEWTEVTAVVWGMRRNPREVHMGGCATVCSVRPFQGTQPAVPVDWTGHWGVGRKATALLILCHFIWVPAQAKHWVGTSGGKCLYSQVQPKSCPKKQSYEFSNNSVKTGQHFWMWVLHSSLCTEESMGQWKIFLNAHPSV